jgi:hypothetical protein
VLAVVVVLVQVAKDAWNVRLLERYRGESGGGRNEHMRPNYSDFVCPKRPSSTQRAVARRRGGGCHVVRVGVVWVWAAFAGCARDPRAAARGRGAGAFAPSVVAVMPCGCVVSVTWRVLRDRVRTLRVPASQASRRLPGVVSVSSSSSRYPSCKQGLAAVVQGWG